MGAKSMRKDLTGREFVWLTVVGFSGRNAAGKAMWLCRCKCGVEKPLLGDHLLRNQIKSCGCYRGGRRLGKRFGKLTVVEKCGSDEHGNLRYLCRCDCGRERTYTGSHLPRAKSCGCLWEARKARTFVQVHHVKREQGARKRQSPQYWAKTGEGSVGSRPGRPAKRADIHSIDPNVRAERLRELAQIGLDLDVEYARMERAGYVRTDADAFAPEWERWKLPEDVQQAEAAE
jgi:hypothetical protein